MESQQFTMFVLDVAMVVIPSFFAGLVGIACLLLDRTPAIGCIVGIFALFGSLFLAIGMTNYELPRNYGLSIVVYVVVIVISFYPAIVGFIKSNTK